MHRFGKRFSPVLFKLTTVFLSVFLTHAGWADQVYLDGQLRVSGFVRLQTAVNTSGDPNPANAALGVESEPDLNLFRLWSVLDLDYVRKPKNNSFFDEVRWFGRMRFIYDGTQDISSGVSPYNAFPNTDAFKDDWTLARAASDTVAAELWEGFVDLRRDSLWMRLGRQNIVWGEADAVRLLDVVNPLDNSWHPFEGGGEVFDHTRVPLWMARATYDLKRGYSIDAFVNPGDFVPTNNADVGAPWNVNPLPRDGHGNVPPGTFLVSDDTDDWRGEWQGGIRLLGSISTNFNYTLNYLSLIDADGVIETIGVKPIFAPPPAPPGPPVAVLPILAQTHSRVDMVGASFNTSVDSLALVIRGEVLYAFDKQFARSAPPRNPPQFSLGTEGRDEYKVLIGFDRPTFVFNKTQTLNISGQVIYTHRESGPIAIDINGAPARLDETLVTLTLSQLFRGGQFTADLLMVYDTDDAYWIQPQLRWQPDNHWRVWAYYNLFGGDEKRSFGVFDHMDELNLAISYQF